MSDSTPQALVRDSDSAQEIHRTQLTIRYEQPLKNIWRAGKLLAVAPDRQGLGRIDLWYVTCLGRDASEYETRTIYLAGTGEEPPAGRYVGTVVMPDQLVWHVFEARP